MSTIDIKQYTDKYVNVGPESNFKRIGDNISFDTPGSNNEKELMCYLENKKDELVEMYGDEPVY